MMIPMTLATRSRNESKLNAISRLEERRLRYMVLSFRAWSVSDGWLCPPLAYASGSDFSFNIFPQHGYFESIQERVSQVVSTQAVGANLEANDGAIGCFSWKNRGLSAVNQLLNRLHQGMAWVRFFRQGGQGKARAPGLDDDRIGGTFHYKNEVAVADQPSQGDARPCRFFGFLEVCQGPPLTQRHGHAGAAAGFAASSRLEESPLSLQLRLVGLEALILAGNLGAASRNTLVIGRAGIGRHP